MDFKKIKEAVAKQFKAMSNEPLFRTDVDLDKLWNLYLDSFPEGTNEIFRERCEYDCSNCRHFVKEIGNVVAVIDGKLVSIWDTKVDEPAYQTVVDALAKFVTAAPIKNIFLHYESVAGVDKTWEGPDEGVITWEHFFVHIPAKHVAKNVDIPTIVGEAKAAHDVLYRSLKEITDDAINTVLDLIAQNSLYRGEEQKALVNAFRVLKNEFNRIRYSEDVFAWLKSRTSPASVSKIRNTAIGTLLIDLSEGKKLEDSVNSFETKVAPANYKRPTALVTKDMIEKAKEKVANLGLTSALERRYAKMSDIGINDIIFADRQAKKIINGDVFDEIATKVKDKVPKKLDKVEEVSIEKFISDIVPKADSIEILVDSSHVNNFVSLVAPVDPTAQQLFKWDNNFSWSYNGDMTDSIKERVKSAGGNVSGDLCCRLAWFNYDDLDLHMKEPTRNEIYFGNKGTSTCGGRLDVDMNAGHGLTREPVENIYYSSKDKMKDGTYTLMVNNFNKRESTNVGFEVEIDIMGTVHKFAYENIVKDGETIIVAQIVYSEKNGFSIASPLTGSTLSKTVWNVQTGNFHKVNVLMLSPNYWGDKGVGNKHYFFMLSDCLNDDTARGFFNEFLKEEFNEHRKVMEIVGNKMQTTESEDQLSGLGFSSTKHDIVLVRVTGSFTRIVKVLF